MADLADFLAMGGYAVYVWPAFGITFLAIGGVMLASSIELGRVRRETFRRARAPRRRRARAADVPSATSPEADGRAAVGGADRGRPS